MASHFPPTLPDPGTATATPAAAAPVAPASRPAADAPAGAPTHGPSRPLGVRLRRGLLLLAALAAAVLLLWQAGRWAGGRVVNEAAARAHTAAQLNTVALRNSLDKFRAVPLVLAQDPEVRATLQAPGPVQIQTLDRKLETLSGGVGASAIYLLDDTGTAIAASNWQEPATFVGVDYRFRPYFRQAVSAGQAEYFALGTISHQPGLYLSRRIDDAAGRLLGVIVLKMEFAPLEQSWGALDAPLLVTDRNGVVLMGNVPGWQFRAIGPIAPEAAQAMHEQQQFGEARLDPLPLAPGLADTGPDRLVLARETLPQAPAGARLLHTALVVPGSDGWTLHLLSPVETAIDRAEAGAQVATLLALAACALAGGLLYRRRHRAQRRARDQAAIQAQLEAQVQQRTAQLRHANDELQSLIDARQHAEARLHRMQDELVQANKLALLGQVAAGVAHEINQPVAAIRAYADNTAEFARRGQGQAVQENLETIAALTDRIGGITGELRAFSRKAAASIAPTALDDALEGALMLVGPRIRRQGVALHHPPPRPALKVLADRMRLEQVFVNLLQNALDALEGQTDARIDIDVDAPADADSLDAGAQAAAGADGKAVHTGDNAENDAMADAGEASPSDDRTQAIPPHATPGASCAGADATRTAGDEHGAGRVRIRIRDNGPGLDPQVRGRLFTPFQTTKPEGLGLGLIISRDILTEFGGGLAAADAAPRGALFTVTLAAAAADSA